MTAEDAPIRLYVDAQYLSPYALVAYVALVEKRVAFETAPVDLVAAEHLGPAFGALSRTRRVPTLTHGDFSLGESSAICEYVDEVFPGTALYPADPQERAKAREIQAWIRSDLMPIRIERSTEVVFREPNPAPLSEAARNAAARLFHAAEALLPGPGEQLFGAWCIADIDLALMLNRLVMNGDAVPARLATYATLQWAHPAVQAWVQQPRPPRKQA